MLASVRHSEDYQRLPLDWAWPPSGAALDRACAAIQSAIRASQVIREDQSRADAADSAPRQPAAAILRRM